MKSVIRWWLQKSETEDDKPINRLNVIDDVDGDDEDDDDDDAIVVMMKQKILLSLMMN